MKTPSEIRLETLEKENILLKKNLAEKDVLIDNLTSASEQKNAEIVQNETKIEHQSYRINDLSNTVEDLRFQLEQLKRMLFGSKRERFESTDQLSLSFDIEPEIIEAEIVKETVTYERTKARKPHPGRLALPSHLSVNEIVLEPAEDVTGMVCIGKETTDELEITPAKAFINRYIRFIYITPENENGDQKQIIAELDRPMPKCIAGPDLLSHIVVDKYVYHLPIYRQLQRFTQDDIHIKSSTMDSWLALTAAHIRPLYAAHKSYVLGCNYLQVDESPIKVQDRDKPGATHQGYMWVYRAVMQNAVYFEYNKGRGQKAPQNNLCGHEGYLQTDGYSVYEQFGLMPHITHLICWAHARRYFDKALDNDKARASVVLLMIQELYAVEHEARERELTTEQRHALRLEKSFPVLNRIGKFIADNRNAVLPQSPIGKAFAYCIARWDNLMNYLKDGNLEIDSNEIENAIRPLALGRKNYLFAGSHEAAENIAMYYSFFATCKKHDIHPQKWLAYVIRHVKDTKPSGLKNLLPQFIDKNLIG
jgi:transposase